MTKIRQPAVAGLFYPQDPRELKAAIEGLLDCAAPYRGPAPKALIVPHAGYIYSGPVAASAYVTLLPYQEQFSRVVLLGPSHRVPLDGLATSSADAFRTPLGDVPLDRGTIDTLDFRQLFVFEDAHRFEHSLEVQLPFLQLVLEAFSLLPIVVGNSGPEYVARVIEALWDGPETLIVVSSDLSHYLPYDQAVERDRASCKAIEDFNKGYITHDRACGAIPLGGLMIAAKRRGMLASTLDLRNSGDTAGSREQVVGYGSWVFPNRDPPGE